jgi:hypothetical protein
LPELGAGVGESEAKDAVPKGFLASKMLRPAFKRFFDSAAASSASFKPLRDDRDFLAKLFPPDSPAAG